MILTETAIAGVVVVDPEPVRDQRGAFARLHCPEDFAAAGWPFIPVQTSLSHNAKVGTLRGLHYQAAPYAETKLVRVTRGRAYDVVVDLRPASSTHRHWTAVELDASTPRALLIPEGIAHGFLTLEDNTDILYQIAPAYAPGHDRGVRWNDPAFGIDWPIPPAVISERDAAFPDYASETSFDSPSSPA
jgi:dTDP-4-dehydrorhamnose 3,5-epimerase